MIDWSYRSLSELEQLLFARLHVFAATFDIAAAEAVTADERVPPDLVAHLVARLAERSLLTRPGYAGAGLIGPDEERCARLLEDWLDDARAAWTSARDHDQIDLAMRLVAALTPYAYWRLRLDVLAWGEWLAQAIPAHSVPDQESLPTAYAAAATASWMRGAARPARPAGRGARAVPGRDRALAGDRQPRAARHRAA